MNDTPQTLEKDVRDNLLLLYDFDKDYDVKLLKYSENVIFKITFKEAFPDRSGKARQSKRQGS